MDFGVGIGWLKEEFENLGMDFASRAARTEEYLLAMRALWSEGISEFSGQTVTLQPCHFNPKPVQKPHPPIYFGGESDPALRRVARLGDGWYGFDLDPEQLQEKLVSLDAALAGAGRSRQDIDLIVGPNRHPVKLTPWRPTLPPVLINWWCRFLLATWTSWPQDLMRLWR